MAHRLDLLYERRSIFVNLAGFLEARKIASLSLGALFSLITAYAVFTLCLFVAREGSRGVTNGKLFTTSIILTAGCRAAFWIYSPSLPVFDSPLVLVLWSAPGVMNFTTFSLLIWKWADVQAQISEPDANATKQRRIRACLAANCLAWGVQALLVALMLTHDDGRETRFRHREPLFLTVIYFVALAFILSFGLSTMSRIAALPASSASSSALLRVRAVTGLLALSFFVRCVVNLCWIALVQPMEDRGSPNYWLFIGVFYVVVEVLPLAVVLVWAGQPPRASRRAVPPRRPPPGPGGYFPVPSSASAAGPRQAFRSPYAAASVSARHADAAPPFPGLAPGAGAGAALPLLADDAGASVNGPGSSFTPSSPFQLPPALAARSYGTTPTSASYPRPPAAQ